MHKVIQKLVPGNPTSGSLPEYPKGNRQCADGQEAASEHIEDLERSILGQPTVDEIREAERQ